MRRAHFTKSRLAIAGALVGALTISATVYALPMANSSETSTNAIVGPDHQYVSGVVTVAASGEQLSVHVLNVGDDEREFTVSFIDDAGEAWSVQSGIVGPDKSATVTFDPKAAIRVHAQISFESPVSIQNDTLIPSAEVQTVKASVATSRLYIGDFKGFDPVAP